VSNLSPSDPLPPFLSSPQPTTTTTYPPFIPRTSTPQHPSPSLNSASASVSPGLRLLLRDLSVGVSGLAILPKQEKKEMGWEEKKGLTGQKGVRKEERGIREVNDGAGGVLLCCA